jgi:hypothetical protein
VVYVKQGEALGIVGITLPEYTPASGWDSLIEHGRAEARLLGCKEIVFQVQADLAIVSAAMRAGAVGQFTLGV